MTNTINLSEKEFNDVLVKAHDKMQRDLFESEGYTSKDKINLEIAQKMIESTLIMAGFSSLLRSYLFESEGKEWN